MTENERAQGLNLYIACNCKGLFGISGAVSMKKFLKWLDNFWYHYKWVTIVSVFVAVVVIIGVVQISGREESDVKLAFFGPAVIAGEQQHNIEAAFEQIMSSDYNNDGKKNIALTSFAYYDDEQYKEKQKEALENDMLFVYDPSTRNDTITQFNALIGTGDTLICLLDEYIYNELSGRGAFETLENLLGYEPELARDDYSVYLKDTDFGKYYNAFDILPDDTILCMCKISENTFFSNKTASKKNYERSEQMFCDIFAFSSED